MDAKFTNRSLHRDIPYLCFGAHEDEKIFQEVMLRFPGAPVIFYGSGDSQLIQKYGYGLFAGPISESLLPEMLNRTEVFIYYPKQLETSQEIIAQALACGCTLALNEHGESLIAQPKNNFQPLVSIIIPAEVGLSSVSASIKSAKAQKYSNVEILLIDETEERTYESIDPNIQYIHKPFGGIADSKNIGVASAKGEWIITLPAGDLLRADAIAKMIEVASCNPHASIISSDVATVTGTQKTTEPSITALSSAPILPQASLFKKSLWDDVGGFYEGLVVPVENWAFWIATIRNGAETVLINETLVYERQRISKTPYFKAVVHSLFPDLFDVPVILAAHESLKFADIDLKEKLLERISRFPWLILPWMWLGLIEESLDSYSRAAKSYIRSVKNSGQQNWQAMIRLHIISALLAKDALAQGETYIAEERETASAEFLEVAQQLIDERDQILAPDWPKPKITLSASQSSNA